MQRRRIEPGHRNGDGNTDDGDHCTQRDPEPADLPVPADVVRTDERRLKDQEHKPERKDCHVKVQESGPRNGGMDQVLADGETESVHHDRNNEQGHDEIEVAVEETGAIRRHLSSPGVRLIRRNCRHATTGASRTAQ